MIYACAICIYGIMSCLFVFLLPNILAFAWKLPISYLDPGESFSPFPFISISFIKNAYESKARRPLAKIRLYGLSVGSW